MGTPLEDPETKSIGVAAGDFDGDGREEVEINHRFLATLVVWIHGKLIFPTCLPYVVTILIMACLPSL